MRNSSVSDESEISLSGSIPSEKATFAVRLIAVSIDLALIGAIHSMFILLTGIQVVASIPFNFSIMTQAAGVGFFIFLLTPFALTMFYFTMFLTLVLCFSSRDVLKWPFTVAWWAFTFPFVSMSSAALAYFEAAPGAVPLAVAVITLALTTLIVAVVTFRTLKALLSGNLLKVPAV